MNPYYQNPYYQDPYHNQNKISKTNIFIVIVIFYVIAFLYLNPEYLENSSNDSVTSTNDSVTSTNDSVKKMNDSIKTFEDCYGKISEVTSEYEKMCKTGSTVDTTEASKMICIHPQNIPKIKDGGDPKAFWTNDRIEPVNAWYKYIKCRNETKNCEENSDLEEYCAKKNNLKKYEGQLCLIQ